jgi:hypothetical protein
MGGGRTVQPAPRARVAATRARVAIEKGAARRLRITSTYHGHGHAYCFVLPGAAKQAGGSFDDRLLRDGAARIQLRSRLRRRKAEVSGVEPHGGEGEGARGRGARPSPIRPRQRAAPSAFTSRSPTTRPSTRCWSARGPASSRAWSSSITPRPPPRARRQRAARWPRGHRVLARARVHGPAERAGEHGDDAGLRRRARASSGCGPRSRR